FNLRVVAHAPQQTVGNARRSTRTARDFAGAAPVYFHIEQLRRTLHNASELFRRVKFEPRHDPEAVTQRVRQHTRARSGAYQRERRQVELDRPRRGPLPYHDVDLEILKRGIEDLFHYRRQTMNLVDKQNVLGLEVGEHGREIARPFYNRARRM